MVLPTLHGQIVERWLQDLEWFDGETSEHTVRVSETSYALALHMGLGDQVAETIRRGAILHDIGKLGIPIEVLQKPGQLDAQERELIETHTVEAVVMIESVPMDPSLVTIARWHHERFDGNGYPDRLSGTEIPLEARLFSVVDVHDALSHDRCYRRAWLPEVVRTYLQNNRGSQFFPEAVDAFLDMLQTSRIKC
jgi:putative nucleotidyltransferase with HDIG domain